MQLYCDQEDPYCSKGKSNAVHQGYAKKYGADALKFVTNLVKPAAA